MLRYPARIKMRILVAVAMLCLLTPSLQAETATVKTRTKVYRDVRIIKEEKDRITIHHPHTGYETIRRSEIEEIIRGPGEKPPQEEKPAQKPKPASKKPPEGMKKGKKASNNLIDVIKLNDGKVFKGKIVNEKGNIVLLKFPYPGCKTFRRSDIKEILRDQVKEPPRNKALIEKKEPAPKRRPSAGIRYKLKPGSMVIIELVNEKIIEGKVFQVDADSVILKHAQRGFPTVKISEIKKVTVVLTQKLEKKRDEQAKSDAQRHAEAGSEFVSLLRKLEGEKPISLEELAARLVELGPPVVPLIIKYLKNKPKDEFISTLIGVLVRLKDEKTVSHLKELLKAESPNVRLAAIHGLQSVGGSGAIEALLDVVLNDSSALFQAARKALIAILRSEPENRDYFGLLSMAAHNAKPAMRGRIMSILGSSGSRLAVAMLLEFETDMETKTRVAVAIALGTLGFHEPEARAAMRRFLREKDAQLRREAVLTLGKLECFESIEEMIPLLEDKNPGVRKNAHSALKIMTGLAFPPNRQRWQHWWDTESQELKARRDALIKQLRHGSAAQIKDAISRLSVMKLGRKETISAFMERLTHGDTQIRVQICLALGNMKATQAVQKLIRILDDPYPSVVDAAHKALRAITGKNLPPASEAWRK